MTQDQKTRLQWTFVALVLGCCLSVTLLSFRMRPQAQVLASKHQLNPFDLDTMQAEDCYRNGNVTEAVALVDKATHDAGIGVSERDRLGQLDHCALDYCGYGRKDKAVALLKSLPRSDDEAGQLAKQMLAGILRNDPAYRTMHIPDVRDRAQLTRLEARLKNDPELAQRFVGQYLPKK